MSELELQPPTAGSEMADQGSEMADQGAEQEIRKIRDFTEAIEKLENLISNSINRTLNFTNLYFVFQGVVFSSIMSSSKKISCELKWIPISLSSLVSIFNFLAVWVNIKMLLRSYKQLENYRVMRDNMRARLARRQGQQGAFSNAQVPVQRDAYRTLKRKAVCFSTLLLLLVFMGIMLCSCLQTECVSTAVVTED